MLSLNIADQLSVQASLRAASRSTANAATADGTGIDIGEMSGTILVVVDAATASSGETMTFTVEHSYDNSTYAAVGSDALVNPGTAATASFTVNSNTTAVFETLALKRDRLRQYVRVKGTAAGDGTPTYVCAAYIIGIKKYDT